MNNQIQQPNQGGQSSQPNLQALAITKALAYTENSGAPNISNPSVGKTGETKSIFQFEPGTWQAYAKQVSGNSNLPMTPQNESLVAYSKVNDWLKKGYSTQQIASMWNAGEGEPNAWEGKFSDGTSSAGTNEKYGVKYDVSGYAKKVSSYTKQFLQQELSSKQTQQPQVATSPVQTQPKMAPQVQQTPQTPPGNGLAPQLAINNPEVMPPTQKSKKKNKGLISSSV